MRAIVIILLTCLLGGCGGGTDPASAAFDPAQTFNSIPRPSELAQAAAPRASAAGKQASAMVSRIPGADFSDLLPNPNTVRHEETLSCALEGRIGELAYCFFEDNVQEEITYSGLLAEFDWAAAAPEEPAGIWLGLPDYVNDRWVWFGPASAEPEWIDTTAAGVNGYIDPSYIAAVNCSEHEAELRAIDYRTIYLEDNPDDSLLYYAHYNPAEPAFGTGISRVQPGLGTEPEVIFAGTETESYAMPRIAHIAEMDYLAYAYTDGGAWQIWRANLDGTDPQPLWDDEGINYLPGDWNENGEACTFLQQNIDGWYNLNAHAIPADTTGLLARYDDVVMNSWWLDSLGTLYSTVFSLRVDEPAVHSVIAWLGAGGAPPFEYPPDILVDNGTEIAVRPYPFTTRNGVGLPDGNFVFSSRYRASATFDLFWYSWNSALINDGHVITLIVDPAMDLTSPAVSERSGMLVYVAAEPNADRGTLYLTDFLSASHPDSPVTWLADEVTGQLVWYWSPDL